MQRPHAHCCALVLGLALLAGACGPPATETTAGEWPQFRGPGGLGISSETDLPVRWGRNSPNLRWRASIPGNGNSSPIVSRGRVFLTTTYGSPSDNWSEAGRRRQPHRVVLAYDLASGEKLWETIIFQGPVGKIHWSNGHATPTPATDGELLFVSFDGRLAALDFEGNIVWDHDVDPDYYEHSHYGASSSPVLADDAVILLQDRELGGSADPGWIAAFAKQTGELIWRDEWTHTCCSYSTPLVVERAGRLEIWNQTALEIQAYDARDGERLWRADISSSQTVPSLVYSGDLLSAPGGMHTQATEMFRLSEEDGTAVPIPLWSSTRGVPEISSPVLYRGRLFSVSKNGVLFVRDALTGEVEERRRLPHGEYRPSIVAGDGKVYVQSEEGLTVVLDAESESPEVLSRNRLGGSGASLAIADGSLIVRTKSDLVRIDRMASPPAPSGSAAGGEEASAGSPSSDAT